MKKTRVMALSFVLAIATSAFGQSIADQLLVAKCSFRLFDGSTEVVILDQMVTKRAAKGSNPSGQAYFIEITYKGKEMELADAKVEFLDANKRPLHAIWLENTSYMKVDTMGNRPSPKTRYIAISLQGIPLRLLDGVVSIRISGGK